MNFMNALENSLSNSSYTENGARGYASTGHVLLDMNIKVPSYRGANEEKIFDSDSDHGIFVCCDSYHVDCYVCHYFFTV